MAPGISKSHRVWGTAEDLNLVTQGLGYRRSEFGHSFACLLRFVCICMKCQKLRRKEKFPKLGGQKRDDLCEWVGAEGSGKERQPGNQKHRLTMMGQSCVCSSPHVAETVAPGPAWPVPQTPGCLVTSLRVI